MSGSVLVIGAGVAGLRAALDLARNNIPVVLVERQPVLGGVMATRLSDEQETFNFARGLEVPKVRRLGNEPNIEVLTLANVVEVRGSDGAFTVTIEKRSRYVTDACTRCARCHHVCPQVIPNQFQMGITLRKAIYTPFKDAYPGTYVIDIENCLNNPPNYLPCQRCVEVCQDNAIHFEMPAKETVTKHVSAIVLAAGFSISGTAELERYGYGSHPDIMTYMELEQLLSPVGPSGGFVEKLTTNATPENVLYVMHDASRFSCACAAAQCDKMAEQGIRKIVVLHNGRTADGAHFGEFWFRMARRHVELVEGELERITPIEDDQLRVRYKPRHAQLSTTVNYDMVVFTTAAQAPPGLPDLARILGIELNEHGFVQTGGRTGGANATSRPGIYVAGCVTGAKDVPDSIAESKSAAIHSMRHLEGVKVETNPPASQSGIMLNGRWLTESELQSKVQALLLRLIQNAGTRG